MATLKVEIVSPEAALWTGEATSLTARSSDGDFTILPQHTSTVGDVLPGVVYVQTANGELAFVVDGGYFQVGASDEEGVTLATVLAGVAKLATNRNEALELAANQAAEFAATSN